MANSTGGNATTSTENTTSKTETATEQEASKAAAQSGPETPKTVRNAEGTSLLDGGMYLNRTQDNTDINSVCKFNFIFYFIYKVKYDEAPSGNEQLDYEF